MSVSSFIDYEYENLDDNSRQYDDIDYLSMKGVRAKYVNISSDTGNPYI